MPPILFGCGWLGLGRFRGSRGIPLLDCSGLPNVGAERDGAPTSSSAPLPTTLLTASDPRLLLLLLWLLLLWLLKLLMLPWLRLLSPTDCA